MLAQHDGGTPGAHLLIGVGNLAFAFVRAGVVSRDLSGRDQQVVIPFHSQVNLVVLSPFFQLADAAGLPLSRTQATRIPVMVAAGQQRAPIRLRVSGGGSQ